MRLTCAGIAPGDKSFDNAVLFVAFAFPSLILLFGLLILSFAFAHRRRQRQAGGPPE